MNGPVIELHPAAVTGMHDALHAALPRETGGILIGWRNNGNVIITDALVVADDQADRTNYNRRQASGRAVLNRYLATATTPLAGYVGEWHTHPEPSPPSATDLASIAGAATQTDAPVAMIVLAWDEKRTRTQTHSAIATASSGHVKVIPARCQPPQEDAMTNNAAAVARKFDLADAYRRRQDALAASLRIPATFTSHGTTIGDASEADWAGMLRSFLPARYGVGPIFAVDSQGGESLQVDLAVYDRQYSPLFFDAPGSGSLIVPVECVYAVLEVKQDLTIQHISDASDKVESVRRLHRTSADVYHLDGTSPGKRPENQPILGGIITQRSTWKDLKSRAARKNLLAPTGNRHLDIGLVLDIAAFDIDAGNIGYSPDGTQLIFFALHLFKRLRPLATALSPDIDAYETALSRMPLRTVSPRALGRSQAG
jgi:integrative and conjugative element protein (TIGR02256 family)